MKSNVNNHSLNLILFFIYSYYYHSLYIQTKIICEKKTYILNYFQTKLLKAIITDKTNYIYYIIMYSIL